MWRVSIRLGKGAPALKRTFPSVCQKAGFIRKSNGICDREELARATTPYKRVRQMAKAFGKDGGKRHNHGKKRRRSQVDQDISLQSRHENQIEAPQ